MRCPEAQPKLDAFVDTELPPRELVEVARHVAECDACDASVKWLMTLHDVVLGVTETDARAVDLNGLWPGVEAALDAHDAQHPGATVSRLRVGSAPLWVAGMAMAAGVLFFFGTGGEPSVMPLETATGPRAPVIERYVGVSTSITRDDQTGAMMIHLGDGTLSRR